MIPDFPDASLAELLPDTMRQEMLSQQQVGREFYHHLKRKHQGFFVTSEGADAVSAVATAVLGMARVLERSGMTIPAEFTVTLAKKRDDG